MATGARKAAAVIASENLPAADAVASASGAAQLPADHHEQGAHARGER